MQKRSSVRLRPLKKRIRNSKRMCGTKVSDLPDDPSVYSARFLDYDTLTELAQVNRDWNRIVKKRMAHGVKPYDKYVEEFKLWFPTNSWWVALEDDEEQTIKANFQYALEDYLRYKGITITPKGQDILLEEIKKDHSFMDLVRHTFIF